MFRVPAALVAVILLLLSGSSRANLASIPVDVTGSADELYFALEEPFEIDFVRVSPAPERGKPRHRSAPKALWLLGHDMSTPVGERKYPKLKQIRYGQKYPEFPWVEGPAELQRNVRYLVEINSPGRIARETFFINGDGKAMKEPAFYRIHDLRGKNLPPGLYRTEGFVAKIYSCPPCPAGARCGPCMRSNIVLSEKKKSLESYALGSEDVIVFVSSSARFELGQKVAAMVRLTGSRSTGEPLNDLELVSEP